MAKNIGILLLALLFAGFGAFFISREGNFSPLDSLAGAAGFLTGDQTQKIEKLDSSLKETNSLLRDLKKEISLLMEKAEEDAQERDKLMQELETERKTIAALEETLKNQEKAGELREEEYKKELALFRTKFEELSGKVGGLEEKIDLLSQRIPEEKKEASSIETGIRKDSGLCQKKEEEKPRTDTVIFNEIAWMGKASSSAAEWIELRNISGKEMDLSGWQIFNKDQKIKVIFPKGAKLLKNGFFLLERTSDKTVPGVKADLIYTGAIKNSDEALYLFDKNCQLQDEVLASSTWPAGDNSTKRTMERKSDKSWQTSANPGGTPKRENSSGYKPQKAGGKSGGGGEIKNRESSGGEEGKNQESKETQPEISKASGSASTQSVKNLLKNEFFKECSSTTCGNWQWQGAKENIKQSSEELIELTLTTTKSFKGFYQYGIEMNSSTTYYAQICLKGKGIVRLGIKYPASKYVYYGEKKAINSEDWVSVSVSKKPKNSGSNGGIKLNLKYDEEQGIPKNSKIFIGAAWLGTAPPPENYCSI